MTVYVAKLEPADDMIALGPERPWWFASLDGEVYLPVTREPAADDGELIADLMAGKGKQTVPMKITKRGIQQDAMLWKGEVEFYEAA